jgi:hypothetical protein
MGATLGRLFVYDFNLNTKQRITWYDSIDFAGGNPFFKANFKTCPHDTLLKTTGWSPQDVILRVVMIGAIDGKLFGATGPYPMTQPICYIFTKPEIIIEDFNRDITEDEKNKSNEEKMRMLGLADHDIMPKYKLKYGSDITGYDLDILELDYKGTMYSLRDFKHIKSESKE